MPSLHLLPSIVTSNTPTTSLPLFTFQHIFYQSYLYHPDLNSNFPSIIYKHTFINTVSSTVQHDLRSLSLESHTLKTLIILQCFHFPPSHIFMSTFITVQLSCHFSSFLILLLSPSTPFSDQQNSPIFCIKMLKTINIF